MPPYRLVLCLTVVASTALAQPPRPAPIGAKADGITYGVAINGGLRQPFPDDSSAEAFLKVVRPHPVFLAFQAEGREWVGMFSRATLEKFDYVFTDAMTWSDDAGKRMRLWIPEEVGTIADRETFMETLVARATRIFAEEPVDLYVNPTFLPDQLQADYDTLWTPARMKKVVDALAASGIGMEINNRYRIPSRAFIALAKQAGVKFSCGTNNTGAADLGHNEYCREMIKACDLRPAHLWSPPAEGKKAVQRKGALRR